MTACPDKPTVQLGELSVVTVVCMYVSVGPWWCSGKALGS